MTAIKSETAQDTLPKDQPSQKLDDLDYTPNVEFEENTNNTINGKLHFVADCPLVFLNTSDPRGQGATSLRPDGLSTVTNDLIGEPNLKFTPELFLINFYMKHNHLLPRFNSTLILVRMDGNALTRAGIMPSLPFLWIV